MGEAGREEGGVGLGGATCQPPRAAAGGWRARACRRSCVSTSATAPAREGRRGAVPCPLLPRTHRRQPPRAAWRSCRRRCRRSVARRTAAWWPRARAGGREEWSAADAAASLRRPHSFRPRRAARAPAPPFGGPPSPGRRHGGGRAPAPLARARGRRRVPADRGRPVREEGWKGGVSAVGGGAEWGPGALPGRAPPAALAAPPLPFSPAPRPSSRSGARRSVAARAAGAPGPLSPRHVRGRCPTPGPPHPQLRPCRGRPVPVHSRRRPRGEYRRHMGEAEGGARARRSASGARGGGRHAGAAPAPAAPPGRRRALQEAAHDRGPCLERRAGPGLPRPAPPRRLFNCDHGPTPRSATPLLP